MSWETELNKIFGSGINQNSLEQADALRGAVDVGDLGAFDDELEMVTTAINNQPPAPTAAQNL
jgi:hypothetical protein